MILPKQVWIDMLSLTRRIDGALTFDHDRWCKSSENESAKQPTYSLADKY